MAACWLNDGFKGFMALSPSPTPFKSAMVILAANICFADILATIIIYSSGSVVVVSILSFGVACTYSGYYYLFFRGLSPLTPVLLI